MAKTNDMETAVKRWLKEQDMETNSSYVK